MAPKDSELRMLVAEGYRTRLAKVRADGNWDEARELRKKLGGLGFPEEGLFDIKIVMTWDVMSDVDMDVFEPDGVRINHNNRVSKVGGVYSADNTTGLGPETYTLVKAPPGIYRVGAHLHGGAKSTVKFVVILFEDSPREERREETIVLEKPGDSLVFIRDLILP